MEEVILSGRSALITYADGRTEYRANMVPDEDEQVFELELEEQNQTSTNPYAYS